MRFLGKTLKVIKVYINLDNFIQFLYLMNRPIFNVFKFNDWLHEKFGDDSDKIAYYFGIEIKEK